MVVLGGGAVSYERGALVAFHTVRPGVTKVLMYAYIRSRVASHRQWASVKNLTRSSDVYDQSTQIYTIDGVSDFDARGGAVDGGVRPLSLYYNAYVFVIYEYIRLRI